MKKRIISLLLVVCMVISMIPNMAFAEDNAEPASETTLKTDDELWAYEEYKDGIVLTEYYGTSTDVYIPSTVEIDETEYAVIKLGDSIFEKNDTLNSVTLGAGIKEIGARAFYDADNMVCLLTSEELTTIGDAAFYNCDSFNSIILYDAIEVIGTNAFAECVNLTVWCNEETVVYEYVINNNISYKILNSDAEPETVVQDGITYYILNGEAIVINFDASCTEVIVPSRINGYPVTALQGAFSDCSTITKVTLPNSIKKIGTNAFYKCRNLEVVSVPDSVTVIGDYAFSYCEKLSNIVIPNGVVSIGQYAFERCKSFTEIKIPDGIDIINYATFYRCENLTIINIPDSVKTIEQFAFYGCSSMIEVAIPEGITIIDRYVFCQCLSLKEVIIPEGVICISDFAFSGCADLSNVSLPDSLNVIGYHAFWECSNLTDIIIPDNVREISESAFRGCTNLMNAQIPEGVDSIGIEAFASCPNLQEVIIPYSVCYMDITSFDPETVLLVYPGSEAHSFVVNEGLLHFEWDGSTKPEIYYDGDLTYYLLNGKAVVVDCYEYASYVEIPEYVNGCEVTEIQGAFKDCTSLEYVSIPNTIRIIGVKAFASCTNLQSIDIPRSVSRIASNAFLKCSCLLGVNIPGSVLTIGNYAFYECSNMGYINFEYGTTSVGKEAFRYCSSVQTLWLPDSVIYIGESAFEQCTSLSDVTLSNDLSDIGNGAFRYCTSLEKIIIPDGVQAIQHYAFEDCDLLQDVILPSSLLWIGLGAFRNCPSLQTIVIPESITSLETDTFSENTILLVIEDSYAQTFANENGFVYFVWDGTSELEIYQSNGITYGIMNGEAIAINFDESSTEVKVPSYVNGYPVTELNNTFSRCYELTSVILPEGLIKIGRSAFSYCTKLNEIIIPQSVNEIGESAFESCFALQSIVIPVNLRVIGRRAFVSCTNLKEVTILRGLTTIREYAFYDCRVLEKIVLPDSVTSVGQYAFFYCSNLKNIILSNNITVISNGMFTDCTSLVNIIIPDGVTSVKEAFSRCTRLKTVLVPESVTSLSVFPASTILLVYEDSYAHNYAVENDLLYFVMHKTDNPEISYGTTISGTVTYGNGTTAENATIDILYNDGTVKETVATDVNGAYEFTYAEVGQYTIRATDAFGYTTTQKISVKRMNVFDVFLSGDTNLILKQGWSISGTISEKNATITLTDEDGNILDNVTTEDGTFTIEQVPNGTYILKVESENGIVSKEITVFDGDVAGLEITIATETTSIWGYVEVEDREKKHQRRNWVQVTIYNEDGNAVAQCKSDKDGKYEFTHLPLGEYTIVAETVEMRPDKKHGYDRSHTLTGYAYVNVEEETIYQAETIILYEENDSITTISGKVTAKGETQACEVTLRNVFRYEVASQTTKNNGKYAFKNVKDGLYFITATTESDGMGFAVVVVKNGRVYGETDIKVLKSERVQKYEDDFRNDVPECETREDALKHRERIAQEKRHYDGLSHKEKKQLSKEYIRRLNQYCEWLANCEYTTSEGVTVEQGGLVVSGKELEDENTITFNLNVEKKTKHELSGEGVNSNEDYIQHSMEDASKKQHDYGILEYYEISMTKKQGEKEQAITSVYKDTDATGKFRITIDIPEECRGYKHYSFIHVHKGEVVTLVDLDDDPNTVTFEVDAFSTFALLGTDEEQTGQFVVGDLDNDSDFTELDIAIIRTYLTKKVKSFDFATSDVNEDNAVDIRDVIALKRGIVEGTLTDGEEGTEGGEVESPDEEW